MKSGALVQDRSWRGGSPGHPPPQVWFGLGRVPQGIVAQVGEGQREAPPAAHKVDCPPGDAFPPCRWAGLCRPGPGCWGLTSAWRATTEAATAKPEDPDTEAQASELPHAPRAPLNLERATEGESRLEALRDDH